MEDGAENSLADKVLDFGKKNWVVLALFGGGLIFLSLGLIQMLGANQTKVKFEKGIGVAGAATGSESAKIKVDISGEVMRPGVYSLPAEARVQDALIAAGGLTSSANRNYVDRAINLAQKITDGAKIYIPAESSIPDSTGSNTANSAGASSVVGDISSIVSINSGTESELDSLPGIGPVTAQKIIDGRPFGVLEDLVSKKVLGQKTFDKIKSLISL